MNEFTFSAELQIIDINPFVFVPEEILCELFRLAGKSKGFIPITGTVNGRPYRQTLVRYRGHWRLYINTIMLDHSPARIGETIEVSIGFDDSDRSIPPHPQLLIALSENPEAKEVFDMMPPSRQKEIVRYIAALKTEESVEKNIQRAINFLKGKERFIGRDRPL